LVQVLLAKGADINTADSEGFTPLMRAAQRGLVDTMELLIDRGADLEVKNHQGETALMTAARARVWEAVELLLSRDAKLDPITDRCLARLRRGFRVKDVVEARFKGREAWFKGRIVKVRDASYDIQYDDGDTEQGVPADRVRFPWPPVEEDSIPLAVGAAVEAHVGPGEAWSKGTITAVNPGQGSFDVCLEDGRLETGVPADHVRAPASQLLAGFKLETTAAPERAMAPAS
jgi:hypothetical protein